MITGFTNSLLADNEWAKRRIAELEAENAALEGKAGDEAYVNNLRADNRKMALSNAGMTMKIAELERQLMAYRDCANCAESSPPTKRQQVAERVLMAIIAHYGSPDEHENHIERVYLNVAQWLRQCARFISALGLALCKTLGIPELIIVLESMAAVLEEAAREEQE